MFVGFCSVCVGVDASGLYEIIRVNEDGYHPTSTVKLTCLFSIHVNHYLSHSSCFAANGNRSL